MKYSIAFKNLPFEPEKRQVIYVENQYDEHINAVIMSNYEQIKETFKQLCLDFVYLPMFFNDEETKEKILYYAPYLTSDIIEKAELRSSYLLRYMSHIENKDKIIPSFLYAPCKEDDEWIFQGQSVDTDGDNNDSVLQWLDTVLFDITEELVSDEDSGTRLRVVDEEDDILSPNYEDIGKEPSKAEYSSTPDMRGKFEKWLDSTRKKNISQKEKKSRKSDEPSTSTLDDIYEEDVRDTLEELERNVERLRILGIPLSVITEFVAKYETVSRLLITDDNRILLPDYNIEVTMPPLYKAVFLLFIYRRKEGIILQQLEQYHSDLVYFYRKTKKTQQLTPKQLESINKLESSWNNDGSIYVVLTRIKIAFKTAIDEHLAKYYYIVGRPGEPYNIALNPELIEWEEEYE